MELHSRSDGSEMGNAAQIINCTITLNSKTAQLISNPYTDPIGAVIREITCNAVDVNGSKPIDIHMPNQLEPWFAVKDTGGGIGPENMAKLYTQYGASTKDVSADSGLTSDQANKFIGGFGIGRFSALTYGESFTIIDCHKPTNTKTFYAMAKDAQGVPALMVTNRAVLQSHELGGFEVKVPVKISDIARFKSYAESFFVNLDPRPNVTGSVLTYEDRKVKLQAPDGSWKMFESNNRYRNSVVMGPVRYAIDLDQIKTLNSDQQYRFRSTEIEFYFPIGAIEVAFSRESVAYSEDTRKKLDTAYASMLIVMKQAMQDKINAAPTLFEAKKVYDDVRRTTTTFSLTGGKFEYKGQPLLDSTLRCNGEVTYVREREFHLANLKFMTSVATYTYAGDLDDVVVLLDDIATMPKPRPFLRPVLRLNFDKEEKNVIIVTTLDQIAQLGNPPFQLVSSLEIPPVEARSMSIRAPRKQVPMRHLSDGGGLWHETTRAVEDGGVYVPLFNNEVKGISEENFNALVSYGRDLGLLSDKIFGVPASVASSDKMFTMPGWVLVPVALKERLVKYIQDEQIDLHWSSWVQYSKWTDDWSVQFARNMTNAVRDSLPATSYLRAIEDQAKLFNTKKFSTIENLAPLLGIDFTKAPTKLSFDFEKTVKAYEKRHPMMSFVGYGRLKDNKYSDKVIAYLNR